MGDTSERARPRRANGPDLAAAAACALLVLALGTAGVLRGRALDVERRASADERALGRVATAVGRDLERGLRGVAAASAAVPSSGLGALSGAAIQAVPGASALGFVPVSGSLPAAAGPPVLLEDRRTDPAVAAVLDRTRDSGDPGVSAPVDLGSGPRLLLVSAVYGSGEATGPPVTSEERRARLAGWVVAPVDLGALVVAGLPQGAVASIEDTGTVLAAPATRPAGVLPTRTVPIDGRSLVISTGDPDGVGLSSSTVALAVVTLVAALSTAGLVVEGATRMRWHRRVADGRGAQVRLIGDVAPIVQQSLELGEVLPAVAVQLSDHFGLAGVSLSAGSSRAEQTQLFSLGVAPDPNVSAVLRSPDALAAGDTLTLALQRGGRSVALLQIVAGRRLEATELESLQALTELVTAALVNASLYASQQEALGRMRELDGLKTVFLGTASHELRTPATAIAGFASLLASSWDRFSEEERRDFVGRIAGNARSLSAVVQDLLDFSVLDRNTLPVLLRPIDLGTLVESVIHRLGPAFTEHRIECATEPAPLVGGDQNGLERITTNLLANAVKFSPPGSTIAVTVGPSGDGAALVVADEGPGIPAAEREQVFTRFYRGTGAAVVRTRGVGIGLSVVAEFVTRMGGEVVVDDAPGGGARFTVRIPAARPRPEEEAHDATTA